jgi:hypothetical protein
MPIALLGIILVMEGSIWKNYYILQTKMNTWITVS